LLAAFVAEFVQDKSELAAIGGRLEDSADLAECELAAISVKAAVHLKEWRRQHEAAVRVVSPL